MPKRYYPGPLGDWADQGKFLHPERRQPRGRRPQNRLDTTQAVVWGGAIGGFGGLTKDLFDGTLVSNGQELGFMTVQSLEWVGLGALVGALAGYGVARFVNSRR